MEGRTTKSIEHSLETASQLDGPYKDLMASNGLLSDSLVAVFESVSVQHADQVAAVCGSDHITYADLNQYGNRIARRLIALDLEPGAIVAVYIDRSIGMLAAMLGILKAGKCYLPIDPSYPVGRVVDTMDDACPAVLITDRKLATCLPEISAKVLCLDEAFEARVGGEGNPILQSGGDNVAYVMYTSGSTGKPKGVLVTHRNVARLLRETQPWFHFDETDVWTMFHSFAFDFSVWEIWGPLLTGGKLVIVPFEVSRSPEDFYALLSEQQVTILNQTPSAFSLLNQIEEPDKILPLGLRVVIFGGEALQYRALRSWFKRHGDSKPQIVNMYGITETTVHVTYRVVTEADAHGETDSPIGVPIPDMQVHLLDAEGRPVKEGDVGEICVGGGGVSRGYLNRPELTAERFVPDPFGPTGARLYKSGDLARRRADGELVYLGRGDRQVKINGFRIELGEVEAALADYPRVQQVCVIAHVDASGRQRLAAYFVAEKKSIETQALSEFLSSRLPPQMMPAFYIQLDAIPLTGNGKVDWEALPKPVTGSKSTATEQESPIQEQVAAAWRKVLGTPNVGLDDNFFDIGGTSLFLIAVRAQLQEELGRQIPITWMFEFTTIRNLAEKLSETGSAVSAGSVVTKGASDGALRVAQEQARRQKEAFARFRTVRGATR